MDKNKASWIALVGLSIANLLGCLDLTIVNTALPAIQGSLNLNTIQLQWVMNALLLALTAFMVIAGKLADRFGRRRILYIGMLLFAVSSLGAGLVMSFHALIFFRFLQGISIAILYTAPVALIPSLFPENTGKAMGILFGVSGVGLTLGPVVGGILTTFFNWHIIFLINLPIILLSFILCIITLPESKAANKDKIDFIGALLLIIALPLLIFTTVNTHIIGWLALHTILSYALTLVLLFLFFMRERNIKFPIINFHLFINHKFIIGLVANFFLAFFYAIDLFFIPLHLHNADNFSSEKIGLILLAPTMMMAIISPLSGTLCDRFGTKTILLVGYMFFIFSALLQIHFYNNQQLDLLLIPYILFGAGWACILSPSLITAMSSLPEEMGGVAIGAIGTWHNFGATLGLAIGAIMSYLNAMHLILATSLLALFAILFGLMSFKAAIITKNA